MLKKSLIFSAVLVLGTYVTLIPIDMVDALMCYNCNGTNSTNNKSACSEPMDSGVDMIDCNDGEECAKISITTGNQTEWFRGCVSNNFTCDNVTPPSNTSYRVSCKLCKVDHCNSDSDPDSAIYVQVSLLTVITASMFVRMF